MTRPGWPALLAGLAVGLCAGAAPAGTLEGHLVTFHVMTWDDPEALIFDSKGRTVVVDARQEFGLEPEGLVPGFDIVPAQVEIGPTRVEVGYDDGISGRFYDSVFNGYVLRFEAQCALFESHRIDADATTMPLTEAHVFTRGNALYINVADMDYGPEARLAIEMEVADCPLS
ncbi:hypothetical protein [Pseudogemmobacter sonorensis]|uniref:hypothetical protein n=1 Tax=Pseudogemmobacter sonorensis TaxID=2989681 RepID=UPI00367CDE14